MARRRRNWLRSLALAHLTGRPQWSPEETDLLSELFREVRRIGTNINQLAQRANEGAQIGRYSIAATVHANEAAKRISDDSLIERLTLKSPAQNRYKSRSRRADQRVLTLGNKYSLFSKT